MERRETDVKETENRSTGKLSNPQNTIQVIQKHGFAFQKKFGQNFLIDAHVLDKIKVDYYGTPTPLQQVGNVSVPEARMIVIQPWEKSLLKPIEKAILTSELGINPTNDGNCIRLVFPEMTEERRKEVSKDVKKKGDNAKVALRNIRRDANEAFKKAEKAGDISEDDLTEMTEKMQKLTDKMVEKVDKAVEEKTKEIMTV